MTTNKYEYAGRMSVEKCKCARLLLNRFKTSFFFAVCLFVCIQTRLKLPRKLTSRPMHYTNLSHKRNLASAGIVPLHPSYTIYYCHRTQLDLWDTLLTLMVWKSLHYAWNLRKFHESKSSRFMTIDFMCPVFMSRNVRSSHSKP